MTITYVRVLQCLWGCEDIWDTHFCRFYTFNQCVVVFVDILELRGQQSSCETHTSLYDSIELERQRVGHHDRDKKYKGVVEDRLTEKTHLPHAV